ncbi:MAG TPA: hypothetical protein VFZ77_21095 [Acidimicrobiales bacterium]
MGEPAGAEPWEIGDRPEVSPDARVVATAPQRNDRRALRNERWWRWLFGTVLALFLLLGVAGVFGVRTATATGSGGGYEVRVTYARVTRPGLATALAVEVERDGGAHAGPVGLAVSARYLDMLDLYRVSPAPTSETHTPDRVIWEFDPPPAGEALAVSVDARLEPGIQWGRDGEVLVLDDGRPVVEVGFHTWVTP